VKARDLVITALLLLLAGVALADALRGGGGETQTARPPDTTTDRNPVEIPERFPRTSAPGRLVFLDENGCRLHEVQVSTGEALVLPPLETGCEVWQAAHGERIAYSLPGPFAQLRSFQFIDLNFPLRRLGTYSTDRDVLLSQDGLDAAWCESDERAFRLTLGDEEPTRLYACPAAFDPSGELAFITPEGLHVGGRLVVRTRDPLIAVFWGSDGSLALRYRGRIERMVDGRVRRRVGIPRIVRDRPASFSPDACVAVLPAESGLIVALDVCRGLEIGRVPARAVAFSPDSRWVALATEVEIQIFRADGSDSAITHWPVGANALAWLG
jgi:hypothetical protein